MEIDSILFDMDGTLWDSRAQVYEAWSGTVEQLSGAPWDISPEGFTGLFGLPMDEIARRLFPRETDPAERERKAQLCYDRENEYLLTHPGRVYPGLEETLEQLSRRWPLYIVSNCQKGYLEVMLQCTGLGRYFEGYLCYGDTLSPKGVTIRRLMERYGLSHSVYLGDTQGDADACAMAEVPFLYAAYGFGRAENPRWTIGDITRLPRLLERLCRAETVKEKDL